MASSIDLPFLMNEQAYPAWMEHLRCPVSSQRLVPAPASLIETLESRRKSGTLGLSADPLQLDIAESIRQALQREDGKIAYLFRDSIPVLLPDHGVKL